MNQRLAAAPLETRAASAFWEGDHLTVYMSNQNAQGGRDEIAGWLGLDKDKVRVVLPDVGGGFGAKIGSDPEFALVAWLARQQGRPVRWNESRSENMTGMVQGRAQRQTVTIGGTREGRVTHYRIDVVQDLGAYPRLGTFLPMFTRMMAPGTYDIANVDSRARTVVTNTTSIAAYRGAGRPEATAAIERAMDLFAAEIGKDPAEVRKLNVVARTGSRSRPRAASSTTPASTPRPSTWPWRTPATTGCAPSRRPAASAATPASSVSASPPTSRSPAAAPSPRTPRWRCTRTAR